MLSSEQNYLANVKVWNNRLVLKLYSVGSVDISLFINQNFKYI